MYATLFRVRVLFESEPSETYTCGSKMNVYTGPYPERSPRPRLRSSPTSGRARPGRDPGAPLGRGTAPRPSAARPARVNQSNHACTTAPKDPHMRTKSKAAVALGGPSPSCTAVDADDAEILLAPRFERLVVHRGLARADQQLAQLGRRDLAVVVGLEEAKPSYSSSTTSSVAPTSSARSSSSAFEQGAHRSPAEDVRRFAAPGAAMPSRAPSCSPKMAKRTALARLDDDGRRAGLHQVIGPVAATRT